MAPDAAIGGFYKAHLVEQVAKLGQAHAIEVENHGIEIAGVFGRAVAAHVGDGRGDNEASALHVFEHLVATREIEPVFAAALAVLFGKFQEDGVIAKSGRVVVIDMAGIDFFFGHGYRSRGTLGLGGSGFGLRQGFGKRCFRGRNPLAAIGPYLAFSRFCGRFGCFFLLQGH